MTLYLRARYCIYMTKTQTPDNSLPAWMLALADREIDKNDPELIADARREHRLEAKAS